MWKSQHTYLNKVQQLSYKHLCAMRELRHATKARRADERYEAEKHDKKSFQVSHQLKKNQKNKYGLNDCSTSLVRSQMQKRVTWSDTCGVVRDTPSISSEWVTLWHKHHMLSISDWCHTDIFMDTSGDLSGFEELGNSREQNNTNNTNNK